MNSFKLTNEENRIVGGFSMFLTLFDIIYKSAWKDSLLKHTALVETISTKVDGI